MEEQNKQNIIKDDVKETIRIEKELKQLQENYENIEANYDVLIKKYKGIREEEKKLEKFSEPIPKNLRISELSTKGEIKELKLELDRLNKEIKEKEIRLEELEKGIEPVKKETKKEEQKDKKEDKKEQPKEEQKTKQEAKEEKQEVKENKEIEEEKKEEVEQQEEQQEEKEEIKEEAEKEEVVEEIEEPKEELEEKSEEKPKAKEKKDNTINRNKLFYDFVYDREDDENTEYQIIIDIKRARAYCFIAGKREYSEQLTETGNSVASAYNKIINTAVREDEKIPLSNYTEFRHAFKGVSPYVVNILARYNTKQLNQYLEDFYNEERNPEKSKYYIQYRNTFYLKDIPKNLRKKLELEIKSSRDIASSDLKMGILEKIKRLKEGKGLQEAPNFKQLESRENKQNRFRESLRYQNSTNAQRQHETRQTENQRRPYREDNER